MFLKDIYETVTDKAVADAAKRLRDKTGNDLDRAAVLAWVGEEIKKESSGSPSVLKGQSTSVRDAILSGGVPEARYGDSIIYLRTDVLSAPEIGEKQNFTPKQLTDRMMDGLVTKSGNEIVWRTTPELKFKVIREPGYYCCFDNAPLTDGDSARVYIASKFKGQESPDPSNPHGYRKDNFYHCERTA